ncbi:ABC transporter ATP-binding protein [candidate division KSB1 bacterium]|nr:ABC transporter ATP-binding protein [candidate division KSB1 bacterium]
MTPNAITIQSLTKTYGPVTAVDNIDLTINTGELFGLIGPDGAGKTTVMRILCGLLSNDSGQCRIFDYDVNTQIDPIHDMIGYMPQRFSLYPDLSIAENLRFFADLFQVDKAERKQRIERLLAFSRLGPFQKRRANDLSGGMKQKLALSCTLIHTPKLLILDEPTTGVDPVSRREFWKILKELQSDGVTLLVSTPYMDEANLCDRVAFMHQGHIMAVDQPSNFANYLSDQLLELAHDDLYHTCQQLKHYASVKRVQLFGDKIHVIVTDEAKFQNELQREKISPKSVTPIAPGIEDVFIELMKAKAANE